MRLAFLLRILSCDVCLCAVNMAPRHERWVFPYNRFMFAFLITLFVAVCFVVAIVSVWLSKPFSKFRFGHYTGYDEKNPPAPGEWRSVQIRYTVLLVFLGVVFTVITGISLTVL